MKKLILFTALFFILAVNVGQCFAVDYVEILSRKFEGREWSMSNNDPATLIIHDGGAAITKAELDALWPEVEAEIVADATERTKFRDAIEGRELQAIDIIIEALSVNRNKLTLTPRVTKMLDKWEAVNAP